MRRRVSPVLAALMGFLASPAAGQSAPTGDAATRPGLTLELNKLETVANGCRGYFVIANRTSDALRELRADVFLFKPDGVILRRVGLTFANVPSDRTRVVLFDLADSPCAEVGRVLVNEILACTAESGAPLSGCADRLTLRTRAGAEFGF